MLNTHFSIGNVKRVKLSNKQKPLIVVFFQYSIAPHFLQLVKFTAV